MTKLIKSAKYFAADVGVSGIELFINCFIDFLPINKIYSTFTRGRLPCENFSDKLLFLLFSFLLFSPAPFATSKLSAFTLPSMKFRRDNIINLSSVKSSSSIHIFAASWSLGAFLSLLKRKKIDGWVNEWPQSQYRPELLRKCFS